MQLKVGLFIIKVPKAPFRHAPRCSGPPSQLLCWLYRASNKWFYRPHPKDGGRYVFSLSIGRRGGVYLPQGNYHNPPAKVPTPPPIQVKMGEGVGGGTPRYLSSQPRCLSPLSRSGLGDRYLGVPPPPAKVPTPLVKVPTPSFRSGWGEGVPKVPTSQPR